MEIFREFGQFLNDYGGWGVSVVLGYWIYRKDTVNRIALAEMNKEFLKLSIDTARALKAVAADFREVCQALEKRDNPLKSLSDYEPGSNSD